MAKLSKNYAILELQNILLKAEVDASKYPSDEDLYLAVAKEIYPQLEQVFRLVFEPVFNELEQAEMKAELQADIDYLTKSNDEYIKIVTQLKEDIKKLELEKPAVDDTYYENLELEIEHCSSEFTRVSKELTKVVNANESLHVNFKEHMEEKNNQIAWLRTLVGSALMDKVSNEN